MIYERERNAPAEGQEKNVLLVLDKQQGKVSAVKGFDKEGSLQTVPPTQGSEFMQVGRNGDIISNLVANFDRKYQDTEGQALSNTVSTTRTRSFSAMFCRDAGKKRRLFGIVIPKVYALLAYTNFYVIKILNFCDMTKPWLGKVEALFQFMYTFYVHLCGWLTRKRGGVGILIHPHLLALFFPR